MSETDDRPDEDLLRAFAAGDAEAMRELLRRHGHAVEVVVKNRLGRKPPERFEDANQSIWLGVIEGAASFDGRSKVRTWIIQIARNHCAYVLRPKKLANPAKLEEDEEREPAAKTKSVPEQAEVRALGPEAVAALDSFPPEEVREFLDYHFGGMSCQEIAEKYGIANKNTVRGRILRVHARLREVVTPMESASGEFNDQLR